MITFFKTAFFSFTIWLSAAIINGIQYASIFSLGQLNRLQFWDSLGAAIIFSLLFSAPASFCLFLFFLTHTKQRTLSASLLRLAFVLSVFSCLFIAALPQHVYQGHWLLLSFIIVSSTVLAVLIHHPAIRSFNKEQHV